ncbi:Phophatidylserine decarboxylase-domain-containing protein [Geranomyces variabilis]|nr:Phophatidylserine decarboxylase-domain-containing protein [Geranomyces variabilis]KAJ3142254.1 hypothetical protein HDU90_004527 [Geranomyces variabilis]
MVNTHDIPEHERVHRPHDWLPADHRVHRDWLAGVVDEVDKKKVATKDLHPVLQEFKETVENDTRLYMLFTAMFEEIPHKKPYNRDPDGRHKQVRDFPHMLAVLNHILCMAPDWNDSSKRVGMVGTPVSAVLDWPMGTPSGVAAFLDPQVNALLKKVLNVWGHFLTTPDSAYVLRRDNSSWFSAHGKKQLEITANAAKTDLSFEEMFVCDPTHETHGYKSWDDFFTRQFRDGVRPVASPDDDSVIVNACESKPFNVAYDVKARDRFWAKGQPYSVVDMLSQDDLAPRFVGGTVYQAFLSALSFHRWVSPVSGSIVKAYVVDGTYFAEPLFTTMHPGHDNIDRGGENEGQGYLAATATRAIIIIEADNKDIGLVAFLGIGMVEVSTCELSVKAGQKVKKGDELGMFHFGGSTHCVMFEKGVRVEGFPQLGGSNNVPVRSQLCRVVKV